MCWAHIEYFCEHGGVIRVFETGKAYGDRYCYALPFHKLSDNVIEFVGVVTAPKLSYARAIKVACRAVGLEAVRERKSGARPGIKEFR